MITKGKLKQKTKAWRPKSLLQAPIQGPAAGCAAGAGTGGGFAGAERSRFSLSSLEKAGNVPRPAPGGTPGEGYPGRDTREGAPRPSRRTHAARSSCRSRRDTRARPAAMARSAPGRRQRLLRDSARGTPAGTRSGVRTQHPQPAVLHWQKVPAHACVKASKIWLL